MSQPELEQRLYQLQRLREQGQDVKKAQQEAWEAMKRKIEEKADAQRKPK